MRTRYRRQNVEGARLLVGERWDTRSQLWLPCYPDLIAHPRHTPAGRRVLLCLEDACAHAALDDSGYRDCGSCRHYRLQPQGLLGTCGPPPRAPCRVPRPRSAACRAHPLLRQRKGEWTPAADLLMMTNDDTR